MSGEEDCSILIMGYTLEKELSYILKGKIKRNRTRRSYSPKLTIFYVAEN